MPKELLVGVDEFSLVLFPQTSIDNSKWVNIAYLMIKEFLVLSKIETLFGEVVEMYNKKAISIFKGFHYRKCTRVFCYSFTRTFSAYGCVSKIFCTGLGFI